MLQPPNILTIAGSDSGGGAGIQADLKTITALGGYGLSVITALTAQSGLGVAGIFSADAEFTALQLKTVLEGFPIAAAKTGMLFSAGIIEAVAEQLKGRKFPLVVDPVSVSQSGHQLLREDAVIALTELLLPGADLVTPNLPEAEMLSGVKIKDADDIGKAARKILDFGPKAVLLKGGHSTDGAIMVTDWLVEPQAEPVALPQAKVETTNNHGTGCTLSAAIATFLGLGLPLKIAVTKAQQALNLALRKSYNPGKGHGPVNHFAMFGIK